MGVVVSNTALLCAAAFLTMGLFWLLQRLVIGTVDLDGRPRGWQLVAAFVLFAGSGVLIARLIR